MLRNGLETSPPIGAPRILAPAALGLT